MPTRPSRRRCALPSNAGGGDEDLGPDCLTWRGHQLFRHGVRAPVAQIEPDETYPGMWRFRLVPDDALSDMVNLSRAKDAAATLVLAELNETENPARSGPGCA